MSEKSCPLGHACFKCIWHTKLRGMNPQTGQEVDSEGCAIAFLPILMIENSQQQRHTSAAVESARNELVKSLSGAAGAIAGHLIDFRPRVSGYEVFEVPNEPN
jgi:hypothetical protein